MAIGIELVKGRGESAQKTESHLNRGPPPAISRACRPTHTAYIMPRPLPLVLLALAALAAPLVVTAQWSLRSPPGYYPGDRDGWTQLGWGGDGRFRYGFYGRPGYWSAGCFGCGTWIPDTRYTGFQSCGTCQVWLDGRGCTQVPSGACALTNIPASCGSCQYWDPSNGCINAAGCGSSSSAAFASSGVSTPAGGGTVIYSNGNGGGGVATSTGGGSAWVGNGATMASSGGGGGATAWAGPGGAGAWPGR